MNCIRLQIQLATEAKYSSHLSGIRRNGPCPICPSCDTQMYCIFSIDPEVDILANTLLSKFTVADFLVCPCCSMYLQGYYTSFIGDKVDVHYHGEHGRPLVEPVLPYPTHPVTLEPVDIDLDCQNIIDSMEYRELWDGIYHMIVPRKLWGVVAEHACDICPKCGQALHALAAIDSDNRLGLMRWFDQGKTGRISLNWVDDFYLFVSCCPDCQLFYYAPVHG